MMEPSPQAYESDPVGISAGSQRIDAKGVSPSGVSVLRRTHLLGRALSAFKLQG